MDFDPASLCDARDACWPIYDPKRIMILPDHNIVCRQHVAFSSECLLVVSAWVHPARFLLRYLCGNCPLCLVSFQRGSRDMLRLWGKRVSVSRDKCRMSGNLLIRILHVQSIPWVLPDLLNCNYSSLYHSFKLGNAVPKSLLRRRSYCV